MEASKEPFTSNVERLPGVSPAGAVAPEAPLLSLEPSRASVSAAKQGTQTGEKDRPGREGSAGRKGPGKRELSGPSEARRGKGL